MRNEGERRSILFLPLDDRPPNFQFVRQLAGMGGIRLQHLPEMVLRQRGAEVPFTLIRRWLQREGSRVRSDRIALLSLDALIYGGLVPSRSLGVSKEVALSRLGFLRSLKNLNSTLSIFVTASLLRSFPKEGPWNRRSVRSRNLAVLEEAVKLVKEGVIEYLLMGEEDSDLRGPQERERQKLLSVVRRYRVSDRVRIIGGTDELLQLLLARILLKSVGKMVHFDIHYSSRETANAIPLYENRPLYENVGGHIQILHIPGRSTSTTRHIPLLLHGHGRVRIDLIQRKAPPTGCPTLKDDLHWVSRFTRGKTSIAIADVAFANGACPAFACEIIRLIPRFRRLYYAAWNTAGNTLGTALAWAAIDATYKPPEHLYRRFLLERLWDDFVYQSVVRQQFSARPSGLVLRRRLMQQALERGVFDHFPDLKDVKFTFPWRRLFEVEAGE